MSAVTRTRGCGAVLAALALAVALITGTSWAESASSADAPGLPTGTPPADPPPAADSTAAEPDPGSEARELADAGHFDAALAVVRAALAAQGDDFGLRWLEAGITGDAGRHLESVALYEKLAASHPARANELLGDLAAERLWADDAAGATRDLRRWLRSHPDDALATRRLALALAQADSLRSALGEYDRLRLSEPADTDLALERALVLGWMGRHGDAIGAYRAVLARDSGNVAARLGLATNENWAGRHRVAARHLEAIVREPGAGPDAIKALAFARYWDADPWGARAALDEYLRRVPEDSEGVELSRRLTRESATSLRFEGGRADDSDDLSIVNTGMQLTWPVTKASTAWFRWRRDHLRDPGGRRDPLRLTAGLRRDMGPAWSVHGELTNNQWGDSSGTATGGEFAVVSRPVDHVRLEAGVSREPVLTRRSVALGISLLDWFGAADLAPTNAVSLHVDARARLYSDGNGAERSRAALRWSALERKREELALSLAMEQLHTHFDPDHGYYAPGFHREWRAGAEARWHPLDMWTIGVTGELGWQRDSDADTRPLYAIGARTEAVIADVWTIELEGGRSDSSLQSPAGYMRTWWQAALARGF